MKLVVVLIAVFVLTTTTAEAKCQTHHCWHRVRVHHLEQMVEKKIDRITPYRCYGYRVVTPCWVITQESATSGFWTAHNPHSPARGIYQLLGHGEPWPVIITSRIAGIRPWISAKYETLKRMLAHDRIARSLPMSAWGG